MRIIIPQSHPNIILVQTAPQDYVAFEVVDASQMSRQDEIAWKQQNTSYAATDPIGRYFLLKIDEIILSQGMPTDEGKFKAYLSQCMIKAANFWHDHYIAMNS